MAARVPSGSVPAREASLCSGNLQSPVGFPERIMGLGADRSQSRKYPAEWTGERASRPSLFRQYKHISTQDYRDRRKDNSRCKLRDLFYFWCGLLLAWRRCQRRLLG